MPTYHYLCGACGYEFEKFQSITADPIKTCPVCAKDQVKRIMSGGSGLIFKGSGFYITDYKNSKSKSKTESGDKPKENKKSEKTKSKPKSD
jgi:putative FmdB family regulatory protein